MALGDFTKTEYNDGATPYISSNTLNNNENKTGELDTEAVAARARTPNKNALINSNFPVNQRGVSGTVVLAAGDYGLDRWKAGSGGCTFTFSYSQNIGTVDISAGTLMQEVLGENLQTDTYILHWQGTAAGRVGLGSYTPSSQTFNVTGGVNTTVEFIGGTLILPKFEVGTIETINIPSKFSKILEECLRYFLSLYTSASSTERPLASGFAQTTANVRLFFDTPVPMRIAPTLVLGSTGSLALIGGGTDITVILADFQTFALLGSTVQVIVATGSSFATNHAYVLTSNARIASLDAEV